MNSDLTEQYSLKSFFANTNWIDFNLKTLKMNNLNHFISNKVDFFHRESFFLFMKNSKYNDLYDSIYLVELEKIGGERNQTKKILMISLNNKITSLSFKKSIGWKQISLSEKELEKYSYNSLKNSLKIDNNEYCIITKIKGNKF
jgi:hypothetical protein